METKIAMRDAKKTQVAKRRPVISDLDATDLQNNQQRPPPLPLEDNIDDAEVDIDDLVNEFSTEVTAFCNVLMSQTATSVCH